MLLYFIVDKIKLENYFLLKKKELESLTTEYAI